MGSLHLHCCGLPGPLQDVVLPQIAPPGHHDASHEPLLFVDPAPREGPTGVHELRPGGKEQPSAEGGGPLEVDLVEVRRTWAKTMNGFVSSYDIYRAKKLLRPKLRE